MAVEQCHVCGSSKIIPDVKVIDHADMNMGLYQELTVEVMRRPTAKLFKSPLHMRTRAWICGNCGHVELFVPRPKELYEAWLQHEADLEK